MDNQSYGTTEARRRANENYRKKRERIEVIFPQGTVDRMKALGVEEKKKASFVKFAVEDMLLRMEKEEMMRVEFTQHEKLENDLRCRMTEYMNQLAKNQKAGRPKKTEE